MNIASVTALPESGFFSQAAGPFNVLDACHQQISEMLDDLHRLMDHMAERGLDETAQTLARSTHLFFTTSAVNHHLDEERHIFPALLRSGKEELVSTVRRLRQDHVWLEANWMELAPRLDSLARGYRPSDVNAVRRCIDGFTSLYRDHIDLEESLAYPQARARLSSTDLCTMSREMAERRYKLSAMDVACEQDDDDD